MKGEVAVVGPYGLSGRKATVKLHTAVGVRSCVKVEVAVLRLPFLIVLTISVDV